MKIKERPEYSAKHKPLAFSPSTNLKTALDEMASHNYGSVIVVNDNQNVVGIVTERDLMLRVLYKNRNIEKTKLSDIMTSEVHTAKDSDNVHEWLRIMSNERFRHLPVVNNQGQLVNLMSQGDFVSYTWPALFDSVKEKTKDTVGHLYEIFLIVLALLTYALLVNLFVG